MQDFMRNIQTSIDACKTIYGSHDWAMLARKAWRLKFLLVTSLTSTYGTPTPRLDNLSKSTNWYPPNRALKDAIEKYRPLEEYYKIDIHTALHKIGSRV